MRAGERLRFDLAYLRRVWPRGRLGIPMTLVVLELNAESTKDSERDGAPVPGTGGDRIFLSPGIEHFVGRAAGHFHPSVGERPPGMEVDEWEEVERSEGERPSG